MIGRVWTPTKAQCAKLIDYFGASILLLEALDVAAVSDRRNIKDGLLLTLPESRTS